jgi:hypothetical protein
MLSGSRAWCSASIRTSGSFSSTPALSDTFNIHSARPSTVLPRFALSVVSAG